ncbi:MAG: GAF domain-containing protein [Candidatus Limnocylindrales bacterium]
MADPDASSALFALQAAARRGRVARRLAGDAEQRLLQSIVDATATLFDAEAASIALYEPADDRLVFRVAAGEQGAGAIGLAIPPTRGLAGYVFSTGQPLALSDVGSDPRFDRAAAERTGYVPRSIAAVPLVDQGEPVGVLQVLDKRGSPTFSLRDMELLAVFARQAAAAIAATRVQRDLASLLREVLGRLDEGQPLDAAQVESLTSAATVGLDSGEDGSFWRLVDGLVRLSAMGEREQTLASGLLDDFARYAAAGRGGAAARRRGGSSAG